MSAASDGEGPFDPARARRQPIRSSSAPIDSAEAAERAYREADQLGHAAAAAHVGIFAQERNEMGAAEEAYRRADERGDALGAFRLGLLLAGRRQWQQA